MYEREWGGQTKENGFILFGDRDTTGGTTRMTTNTGQGWGRGCGWWGRTGRTERTRARPASCRGPATGTGRRTTLCACAGCPHSLQWSGSRLVGAGVTGQGGRGQRSEVGVTWVGGRGSVRHGEQVVGVASQQRPVTPRQLQQVLPQQQRPAASTSNTFSIHCPVPWPRPVLVLPRGCGSHGEVGGRPGAEAGAGGGLGAGVLQLAQPRREVCRGGEPLQVLGLGAAPGHLQLTEAVWTSS